MKFELYFLIGVVLRAKNLWLRVMAVWVVEFSNGGTKLERFLPKEIIEF